MHGFRIDSEEDKYYLMKSATANKLADEHRWWSIFLRPIRSRFTRCQRVTLCLAMTFLYFLGNAMFYRMHPLATEGHVPLFDTIHSAFFTVFNVEYDLRDVSKKTSRAQLS